jgi:hypothetical protein
MPRSSSPDPEPISPALLRGKRIGIDDRGTVLVVGGARTVPGAPALSGTAALRAGAGTLQLAVSERHASTLGVSVPESSVFGLPETASGAIGGPARAPSSSVPASPAFPRPKTCCGGWCPPSPRTRGWCSTPSRSAR